MSSPFCCEEIVPEQQICINTPENATVWLDSCSGALRTRTRRAQDVHAAWAPFNVISAFLSHDHAIFKLHNQDQADHACRVCCVHV